MTVGAQRAHKIRKHAERGFERHEVRDLAADVHIDASDLDTRQLGCTRVNIARMSDRDTELVFGLPRRNLRVPA